MVAWRGESVAIRRMLCCVILLCGEAPAILSAEEPIVAAPDVSVATAVPATRPEVTAAMEHLEPLWENMNTDVVSCEAKFRVYFQISPATPITQVQMHEILSRYQIEEYPERVTELLREVTGADDTFQAPVRHLFEQGTFNRHDIGLLSHINVADFSFIRDGDNKQIHVYEPGRTPSEGLNLSLFRSPLNSRDQGNLPGRAEREGDRVRLVTVIPAGSQIGELTSTNTVDWATGILTKREHVLGSELVQEVMYSGLTTFAGGITFPRCVFTIRYSQGKVLTFDLALLDEARFNEPIPVETFVVDKPEKWFVLDFRGDAGGTGLDVPRESIADVRTLIPESVSQLPSVAATQLQKITPMSLPMRAVLVMNGAALIVLGVWMWKNASLKGPKH